VIVSAYTIPYGLFQLVYGPLSDRIGKLKVITGAMAAFAVGTAACAFVPNIAILALLRFLTGMVAAGIIPVSLAYIGDNFRLRRTANSNRKVSKWSYIGSSSRRQFGGYLW
jgi:MFS family permease